MWDRKGEERKLPIGIALQNKHERGRERAQCGEVSSLEAVQPYASSNRGKNTLVPYILQY